MSTLGTLISELDKQTGILSSPSAIRKVPAYKVIVALGEQAVPELIGELRRDPSFPVVMLLADITKAWPADPSMDGNLDKVSQAWIKWSEQYERPLA